MATIARLASPARFKFLTRWLLGGLFVVAGILHFAKTPFYVAIMPPYLPWPLQLVYISGTAEIGLGALLLSRLTSGFQAGVIVAQTVCLLGLVAALEVSTPRKAP